MSWIYCIIWFKKRKIEVLINFDNKINTITIIYTTKLNLKICHTDIGAQKFDSFTFKFFKIILVSFYVKDKLDQA